MGGRAIVSALIVCLPLLISASPASKPSVNEICPVTPDEQATALHELTFRGVSVRFCCARCKSQFLLNPEPYLVHAPQVPPALTPVARQAHSVIGPTIWKRIERFAEVWRPYLIGALVVLVLYLLAVGTARRMRRQGNGASTGWPTKIISLAARPSTLLVAILALMVVGQLFHRESVEAVLPPVDSSRADIAAERRFASDIARQGVLQGPEFVALLEKTYYRGNDERASTLFNGGVYRTCTFRIGVRNEDGEVVHPGQKITGERLFLRVEIERAPNTLGSHFEEEDINAASLYGRTLKSDDPPTNPSKFSTLDLGKRWAAGTLLGQIDPDQPIQHLDGVVYLCRDDANRFPDWTLAQYGIQYNLRIENGVVMPSSKLWMAALYFTDDLPDERLYEWLSTRPLPEIPDGFRHASETD